MAGRKVDTWTDIGKITKTLDTRIVPVTVSHEGEEKTLTIMMTDGDNGRPIIGISPYLEHHDVGLGEAFLMGGERCLFLLK